MDSRNYLAVKALMLVILFFVDSCIHDPTVDPNSLNGEQPTTPTTPENPITSGCEDDGLVCFEGSVLPIFLSSCARIGCHDSKTQEEEYILDSYNNILKKGISPGNARESKLYKVLFAGEGDQMPPDSPLSQAQKDSIAIWINQGAKNTVNCNCSCDTTQFTFAAIVQPILSNNCVGCHKPGSLGGNTDLSTYASAKVQVDNGTLLGSILQSPGYSPMPQGGKLSDCHITQISNWVDSGAANN